MTVASAPGKVILFGEHAVVSGALAIGSAVDMRVRVTVEDLPGRLEIDARDLGLEVVGFRVDASGSISTVGSSGEAAKATRYVSAVLRELGAQDLMLKVESEIPVAAGLGSSASIVVAALGALRSHLGMDLDLSEVAAQAHRIEKAVQRGLGSPMDTALATFGGYQLVSDVVEAIDLPSLEMVVGYTGRPHETRAEVAKVQDLRASCPDIVEPIFSAIGSITRRAIPCIRDGRLEEVGRLMNINHGLLEAIGVGTRELSELVYASRGAGRALGAKLTGAGGGGCIIALPSLNASSDLSTAIAQARGRAYPVKTGVEGMRVE